MDPKIRGTNAKYEEMWVETSGDSWETVMAKVGSEECPWNIGNFFKDKSNRRTQYFYCRGCGRKGRLKEIIIGDEVVFETVGDSCSCHEGQGNRRQHEGKCRSSSSSSKSLFLEEEEAIRKG